MQQPAITVFSDTHCTLGEGPGYDPATGTVWWFDILEGKLFEQAYPDGKAEVHNLGMMASAMAIIDADRQLLMTEKGLVIRNRKTGALTLHKAIEAENPATRSNDSRVHPSGAFWVGTMGKKAEKGAGSIYWYKAGEVRCLFPGISIPNSICFTADGRTAYFADSAANTLWRVATDPATGLPVGDAEVFLTNTRTGDLDGSVVDIDGNIWNAFWGAAKLNCYSPAGELLRSIELPAIQATCPVFVGPNADRMIVTSAREGLSPDTLQQYPASGQTFLVDLPVRGRHDPAVDL